MAPSMGMLSVGSGKGSHLFGLGDCLGIGVGGAAMGGYSSTGGAFCGGTDWGDGGACPNRM